MRAWLSFAVAALVALPGAARAQNAESTAEAQFERGLKAMEAGQYDVGCPALAESVRLDPRPGALFTLAECEAKWGKLASALSHYDDYLARFARMTPDQQTGQRGRDKIAAQRQGDLRARVPELTLQLAPGAPSGTVVKRDGVILGAPSFGVALPVDPGAHVIVVEAPGRGARKLDVTVAAGEKRTVTLELGPEERKAPRPTENAASAPPASSSMFRPWGYVAAGVGIVGAGVGTALGIVTLGKKSTIDSECKSNVCTPAGKSAADDAKTSGLVSTIGFAVGGAGIATAIVLALLPAPSAGARVGNVRARPALWGGASSFGAGAEAAW